MSHSENVLIIGAGLAGMTAALELAHAGKKVHIVERLPLIGGKVIKDEESFPNLECSTCMVAPVQQDVLQNPNIVTMTFSNVEKIEGEAGTFHVTIKKNARYVSMTDCIGCGMCYEPCPVTQKNEWEENLGDIKAIYVPCAGALPNVPVIDAQICLKLTGKEECSACADSCMFGAIKLDDTDEIVELDVGAIVVATGAGNYDATTLPQLGYGKLPGVYTPFEFERLFASNGPTLGELTLRDSEKNPEKVVIVHCVGREEVGYCSSVCCMYSMKFAHFIKKKLPDAEIFNIYSDVCVPDKNYQKFFRKVEGADTKMIFSPAIDSVKVSGNGSGMKVSYSSGDGSDESLDADMVILATAVVPDPEAGTLAEMVGLELDQHGFMAVKDDVAGSVETSREGLFVAGTAEGPKDVQTAVIQAEAVVGRVMSYLGKVTG
ncbi:MAG: FAD-dependent oxidoreductase [Bacteroidales bacterium]|nr:FAD-dependent oxidoreductase [Candidatus Latescibacterota bacterium]